MKAFPLDGNDVALQNEPNIYCGINDLRIRLCSFMPVWIGVKRMPRQREMYGSESASSRRAREKKKVLQLL
jgi:hypothetical protein